MNVPMNRSLMILIMACVSFENCDKLQMILVCNLLVSKYSPGLGDIGDIGTPEAVCWHNKVLRRCYAAGCKDYSKQCSQQLSTSCDY